MLHEVILVYAWITPQIHINTQHLVVCSLGGSLGELAAFLSRMVRIKS